MTRQEIEKRLEELQERNFYLEMQDHWTHADFEYSRRLKGEIRELTQKLANM